MKKRKKNLLIENASVVTGLNIAERALGFLYRVVLSRFIGAEGVGIYQVALSHYFLLHTVGAGGIPTTVSRFITRCNAQEKQGEIGKTVGAGLSLSLFFTLSICLIFWLGRASFSSDFLDERVFFLVQMLLPILPFACLFEVIRASFWGEKKFLTPALLEVAEEVATVLVGTALLLVFSRDINFSAFVGAKNATAALVIAYAFSFVCGAVCFFSSKRKIGNPTHYLKPLFISALPITAVRTGASLVNSAVAVLFPALLQKAGYDYVQAMQTYGVLTGMAIPVLSIPITLISGLSLVLMPELSSDFYAKNYQRLKENILRGLASAFAISCALIPFFFALGADMGGVIYANSLSGELIGNGCFLLLPMSLSMISTSILNSLGKEKFTFLFYFMGAGGMIALLWLLTPYLYEYAYLAALFFNFSLTAVCNLILLRKTLRALPDTASRTVQPKRQIVFLLLGMAIACAVGKLSALALGKLCGVFPTLLLTALLILLTCVGWFFAFIFVPRKTMLGQQRKN